ncbi:GRP family sugar transporter [Paenibacillus lemnae]|uniref:EamA family transporter n=1 Tax=Paenibacillus lemnae TaxID=1330551 RepID=A0A848M7F3_PAELE|nr:GRP family sugar transporter [Paenibacillus lemnae]NMO96566.1 EamA family transporter [Paenibacillus lemnae]
MDILLALLPALFWGTIVLFNVKLGGGPYSQTLGTTLGALIFSFVLYLIQQPELTMTMIIVGVVSGMFWVLGQSNQLKSIQLIGVSKTMPISTGLQLVSTALFGVIVFREWKTTQSVILGLLAILLVIIGVIFTSYEQRKDGSKLWTADFKKGMAVLLLSTLGYLLYVVTARIFDVNGFEALFPQAIGMCIGAVILTSKYKPYNKYAIKNILPGLIWAAGNMFLFISQPRVGVATSFTLSQMGIVISTLGGIWILGEDKTRKQIIFIMIGIVFIIGSAFLLGLTKT